GLLDGGPRLGTESRKDANSVGHLERKLDGFGLSDISGASSSGAAGHQKSSSSAPPRRKLNAYSHRPSFFLTSATLSIPLSCRAFGARRWSRSTRRCCSSG